MPKKQQQHNYSSKKWRLLCSHHLTVNELMRESGRTDGTGYWSSFSFSVMFSTLSCSLRMPRTQCCASSWLWHRRSRLFLGPLKTTVRHLPSGTDPAICRSVSDWQPSRTHSTSKTETAGEGGDRDERSKWLLCHRLMLIIGVVIERFLMGKHLDFF